MLLLLRNRATSDQLAQMLVDWEVLIKVVVDVRREILTGGGEMHADGEALLLPMEASRKISGAPTGTQRVWRFVSRP